MLQTFPGYISLFARQYYKDLKATTMKTFFKICPQDFIVKHDMQEGLTIFANGSVALWMHLDAFDEQSLRGLEINSACLDQVEETNEAIYLVLDSRIGRWDGAKVPDKLLLQAVPQDIWKQIPYDIEAVINESRLGKLKNALIEKSLWPRAVDGRPRVRNFIDVLCNPDNEFHWVYRRYHPDSLERKKSHFYIERETDENLNDPETIENMKDRDQEWVDKYYKGKWGRSAAQIHKISPLSIIDPEQYSDLEFNKFLKWLLTRGALYRTFDHGETSPACCLWFAAINKIHICYREYYSPDQTISYHRQAIADLSGDEVYVSDIADPSVLYKTKHSGTGKNNFKTSIADEYSSDELEGPPIYWSPGDNNEIATRNRINEWLKFSHKAAHPISLISPAPILYFVKRHEEKYKYGCQESILQLQKQRRELIGSDNGKSIYSDNRDENVTDHAYDPVRYYVAEFGISKLEETKEPPARSFAGIALMERRQNRLLLPNN